MFDLNDPEVKKAIEGMVEKGIAEEREKLMAKNSELLGKLKKAQKDSAIDPAEHQALQESLSATETKLTDALKIAKTATKEAETARKALESENGYVSKLLIDNGLNDALLKAGVKSEMTKAVKALLAGQVTIKVDGDKRIANIGDKPLSDFVGEWAKSDEGKHFVAAPNNQGGGAQGGGAGQGNAKTMPHAAFDALAPARQMAYIKEGGTVTA